MGLRRGRKFHPLLTYGGHTTNMLGNQLFVNSGIDSPYPRNTVHPHEGMTLYSDMGSYGNAFRRMRDGSWIWETSTDGITWSHPVFSRSCTVTHSYSCGPEYPEYRAAGSTFRFVPRAEHEDKYVRAKAPLKSNADTDAHTDGYAYTRVIGKIKVAGAGATADLDFTSGDTPPRVGASITAAVPSGVDRTNATGLWQRCDDKTATPQGCELVGSRLSYTPGSSDLGHYLRAYVYYKKSNDWVRASTGFTEEKVAEDIKRGQWR